IVSVFCSRIVRRQIFKLRRRLRTDIYDLAQPSSPVQGIRMKFDGCEFPNDLLYDSDGLVWARPLTSGDVRVGITGIYAAIAGRIAKVSAKTTGLEDAKGAAIGFLESGKYFVPTRAPVGGVLQEVNPRVLAKPRTMTEAVSGDGGVERVRPSSLTTCRRAL